MTLSVTTPRVSYPGAGSAGPFSIPFRFLQEEDLRVTRQSAVGAEVTLTLATHYTTTGEGEATGTLTLITALAAGETLVIRRDPAREQPTSLGNQGPYFPRDIETALDRLAMQIQAQQDEIDRSVKLGETLPGSSSLTNLVPTSGKVVTGTGTGFTMSALDTNAVALPGQGRTTTTLSEYLAINAVFHVDNYDAGLGGADESAEVQDCFDNMIAAGGGVVQFGPKTYRFKNIVPGGLTTVGYQVVGSGKTTTILRPPAAFPNNPIFDLSNENGPAKHFQYMKIEGANVGLAESTGFKLHVTNGLFVDHCWFAGLLQGVSATTGTSTGIWISNNLFESCQQAVVCNDVVPTEWSLWNNDFYDNVQSLQFLSTGSPLDCSTLLISGFNDIGGGNTLLSVYVKNCINFQMSNFAISLYAKGISLDTSPDAIFSHGRLSNTVDWETTSTFRLFTTNVTGDFTPWAAAGLYVGTHVGDRKQVTSRGVPTTLAWVVGDRAVERTPVVGQPKAWSCTVAGTPGTWVSEGNL